MFVVSKPTYKERYFFASGGISLPPGTPVEVLAIGGASGGNIRLSGTTFYGSAGSDTLVSNGSTTIIAPGRGYNTKDRNYDGNLFDGADRFPIGGRGVGGLGCNADDPDMFMRSHTRSGHHAVLTTGSIIAASQPITVVIGDEGIGGEVNATTNARAGGKGAVRLRWYDVGATGFPVSHQKHEHIFLVSESIEIPLGIEIFLRQIAGGGGGGYYHVSNYYYTDNADGGDTIATDGTTTITAAGGLKNPCNSVWSLAHSSRRDFLLGSRGACGLGHYAKNQAHWIKNHALSGQSGQLVADSFISASTTLDVTIGDRGKGADYSSDDSAAAGMPGAAIATWWD